MDLYKEWEQLNKQVFSNQSIINDEIMNAITSESSSAIHKIKKGLKIKSYWILLFIGLFSVLMFLSRNNLEIVMTVGVVNLIYILGFFNLSKELKKIDVDLSTNNNVLDYMKRNVRLIERSILFEKYHIGFTTPIIGLCGLAYGRLLAGATIDQLLHDPSFLKMVIIAAVVCVPFVFIVGELLNKKAFGTDFQQIKENINKLQGIELLKSSI